MNNNIIRIKNAVFYAYHGVETDEQNLGGKFEVDVELVCDLSSAVCTDNLKNTVDYEAVYSVIQKIVTAKKYFLLETLADTIANGLLKDFDLIQKATIHVRKPHPRVKGVVDYVEVELTKERR